MAPAPAPWKPLLPHEHPEAELLTLKKGIARALARHLDDRGFSTGLLAWSMETSRAHVHRLLDERDPGVTLRVLHRAALVLGLRVEVRFVPRTSSRGRPSRRRPSSRRSSSPP